MIDFYRNYKLPGKGSFYDFVPRGSKLALGVPSVFPQLFAGASGGFLLSLGSGDVYKDVSTFALADGDNIFKIVPPLGSVASFDQADLGKQPTLKISGASRYMYLDGISQTAHGAPGLNLGQGSWWCCAMINPVAPNWQVIFGKGDNASDDNIRMFLDPTNQPYVHHGAAAYTFSTMTANTGVPNIVEWGIDATTNEVFYGVNGVEERISITLMGTGSNATDWYLGQDPSGSDYGQKLWMGDGSLLVDYLPDADMRLAARQEIAAKHGVTLS